MNKKTLRDVDLKGKRVVMRVDIVNAAVVYRLAKARIALDRG